MKEGVEDYCQAKGLEKEQKIQKIVEDRELQERKASENNQQEFADYLNKLQVKIKMKTTELKKCYKEKYTKLENEEAENFQQAKGRNCK